MIFYGKQILNDTSINQTINYLISINAIKGKDYISYLDEYVIIYPTPLILNDDNIYKYEVYSINDKRPYIGRQVDYKNKIVKDYIFNKAISRSINPYSGPWTIGWTYDYNYTSVINGIMKLVETIPQEKRHDKLFVATYICSRIDSCNDPINGIIEGRWESTFTGGKNPIAWNNSRDIFRSRYMLKSPVKYGQCWVLADILTGILNFIGLESRTVKIQPCIIDYNSKNGIDYCVDSDEIKTKGNNEEIDPRNSLKSRIYNHDNKGIVYIAEPELEKDSSTYYDLNYFVIEKINSSWNYHVWTEVFINKSWYIYDPSPLHNIDEKTFPPYNENRNHNILQGLKYFGPVNILNIINNKKPKYIPRNFEYIYTCLNGQTRLWKPLISESEGTILYLDNIIYNKVIVSQKDAYGNILNVTKRYKDTYFNKHINNPIYFSMKNNSMDLLYVLTRDNIKSLYIVQISLFMKNTLVYMHREKMELITYDELFYLKNKHLKKYRSKADRLTLTIYDINRNLFWSQCLKK